MAKHGAAVRERLSHPVIDIDGHTTESFPALAPYLRDEGVDPDSPRLRWVLPGKFGPPPPWYYLTPEERAARRVARPPRCAAPASDTRLLAPAHGPRLIYERL